MTKRETHLIESSNSSIRDNLARFNRKSKRFSKSWEMLYKTINLFINRSLVRRFLWIFNTPFSLPFLEGGFLVRFPIRRL